MVPISLVGLFGILLSLDRLWVLYLRNGSAGKLAGRVIAECAAGHVAEAAMLCRHRRGTVPRVMAACLARYEAGQRAMEDAVAEQLLHEVPKLQRGLGGIAVLAGVAPMLGLLGTVTGIISTFEAIRAFGTVNPEAMAAGISEALIATATGLIIAVPVVIVHSMLRGRADSITADAERYAAALLTTLTYGPPRAPRGENFEAELAAATDDGSQAATRVKDAGAKGPHAKGATQKSADKKNVDKKSAEPKGHAAQGNGSNGHDSTSSIDEEEVDRV
jgi:biopolymer transport protein ExbB